MDSDRFDDIARTLGTRRTRRLTLGWLGRAGAGAALAVIGLRPATGRAQTVKCGDQGCRCRAGLIGECVPGLVCCPDNPAAPAGDGTCVAPSQCFGGLCNADLVACPATCTWGRNCLDCCSGHCGQDGLCGPSSCRRPGCDCITGSQNPCDEGLACCPTIEGLLGGPGICAPRGICS